MKKILIILLFILSSCQIKTKVIVENIVFKAENILESIEIDSKKIIDKVELLKQSKSNLNSFLLYIYSPSCPTCKLLNQFINRFIKLNKAIIYKVNIKDYKTIQNNDLYPNLQFTPSFIYYQFKDSTINYTLNPFKDDFYSSYNNFSSAFFNSFKLINFSYINDSNDLKNNFNYQSYYYLNEMIKNKILFIFIYHKCLDCISLFEDILFQNIYKNNIYLFDVEYYFERGGDIYKNFTSYFEFDDENILGNIPTMFYYENNIQIKKLSYKNNDSSVKNQTIKFLDRFTSF